MPRLNVAYALPHPLPPLPTSPHPEPTPLSTTIASTIQSTDYDTVALPLTNDKWRERWDRLCTRAVEDGEPSEADMIARDEVDREADIWRRDGGLEFGEVNMTRLEEAAGSIGIAAEWLEMDSPDEGIRFDSELALKAELAHALYLSLPTLILPAPTLANRAHLPSYARAISGLLAQGGVAAYTNLSIRIHVSDPAELIGQGPASSSSTMPPPPLPPQSNGNGITNSDSTGNNNANKHKRISSISTRPGSVHQNAMPIPVTPANQMRVTSGASSMMSARSNGVAGVATGDPSSTWEMWDCIRRLCGYHPRLSVTLDLSNPLPPSVGALARWTAEPVKYVWLPGTSFISNAKGYPVLSKACQAFLKGMAKQNPTFILSSTNPSRHPSGGPTAYLQYLRHITSPSPTSSTNPAEFTSGYADYLQAPLQPLMDDLGSATYDVFERDPVKYRQYEEATFLALSDLPGDQTHVITVAGAGRGPLVACALRAVQRSNRKARVYAVEKNASAFITLQERKATEWHDSVTILYGDMRTLTVPEGADILVSELLGSFGDNELSPECLDGAMRFLKPTGISIPASYTAHLAPISSSKLYADVTSPARPAGASETPYVVMMSAVNILSGDGGGLAGRCGEKIQQCWQFEHPRRDLLVDSDGNPLTNSYNTRSSHLTFSIPHSAQLHGLAGYFEAHLYAHIGLSIHPDNAHRVSPDMFSWFPMFFPFKEPLYLPSGSELEVSIWRLWVGGSGGGKGRSKIWYEWCAEVYLPLPLGLGLGVGGGLGGIGTPMSGVRTGSVLGIGGGVGGGVGGGPMASPMMDAPGGPMSPGGASLWGVQTDGGGRVKIGGTTLHNPAGGHSWVGL